MASVPDSEATMLRFDAAERVLHWGNALLFLLLAFTGAAMFFTAVATFVGNRELVRTVHDLAGFAVGGLAILALLFSPMLRRDLSRIDRFDDADSEWLGGGWYDDLIGSHRRGDDGAAHAASTPDSGKFNAGQKLNAVFTAAATTVLFGTGMIMYFQRHFPLWLKQGAILVHDLTAVALTVAVLGHVILSLRDGGALRGMVTGRVRRDWAETHHRAWARGAESDHDGASMGTGSRGASPPLPGAKGTGR